MTLRLATWNINSVRHRERRSSASCARRRPDVLCLQETKTPVEKFPLEGLRALGYAHVVVRGEKAYNGVAILSRLPLETLPHRDFCTRGDARHVAARLPSGAVVHNLYIPAGGDLPDPALNPKFAHKLDFLAELRAWFADDAARARHPRRRPQRRPARGRRLEPQAAPQDRLAHPGRGRGLHRRAAGRRLGRRHPRPPPRGPALLLVVLPRPRLAGRRQGPPPRPHLGDPRPRLALRRQPHRPPRARLGHALRPRPRPRRVRGLSRDPHAAAGVKPRLKSGKPDSLPEA